ncbi:MAG: hypothetical protein H0X66_12790 [Verrucomicrobia bacterium]|nr:hypothetical protein [Verrucomicrobiota bacterium]
MKFVTLFKNKALLAVLAFVLPWSAFGKAAYYNKEQAIRSAEIIAIVDILKVKPANKKTEGWTYSKVAEAKVERVLKGELPETVKLYGGENFICAQVKYKPGKHLVFLGRNKDLLVGVNWHLAVLPITGDSVEWYASDKGIQLQPTPLSTALEEIKAVMENDWPVLVHVRRGNRRTPGPELKFAYWQDGTVLLRADDSSRLLVGKVEHPGTWRMWNALREAAFFTTSREGYVVPDASYETIMIHSGNESAVHSWHGVLTPNFGGNIETDAEYRSFVEMWKQSVAAIAKLTPTQLRPLSEAAKDGTFRGYVVDKPAETEWLNERKWKSRL